jgi:hypothetical protein
MTPEQIEIERKAFEAFVLEWTGRDMKYHEAAGTWGLGLDSFSWAAYLKRAEKAQRVRDALERITAIENKCDGGDWDEIEEAREIARTALKD